MECEKIIELLGIPPEDRTPEEERLLREHLDGCSACRAEEELLSRMDRLVSASLEEQAVRADLPPARAPVFNIASVPSSPSRRFALLTAAAALIFAIGTAALGFMLGSARTRVEMLEGYIRNADRRSAQLEQQMEKQTEQIERLQTQKTAVPRTVNYYMFTPRETGMQEVSLPGFTHRQGEEYVKEWF